mmetsp:Transcript_28128/g.41356  ORF Transcript_28128/g.41356 Transcript_28128/m.41356 type:complete len:345 (+) Transcript_28128:26-1060(+)
MLAKGAALLALSSGAVAFMSPMPAPAMRFAPRVAGHAGATLRTGTVILSSSRRSSLHVGMVDSRVANSPVCAPQKPDARTAFGPALAKTLGAALVISLASVLVFNAPAFAAAKIVAAPAVTWWSDAKLWGFFGAIAGWGMSLAAIKDATTAGPEIISENMTFVMLIYSFLFAWWAWIVAPQNLLLCACHLANIGAQANQARRLVAYKLANGQGDEVSAMGSKAAMVVVGGTAAVIGGPALQGAMVAAKLGGLSSFAASAAGPFTVHFWAPMSKWLISGASFLDLKRPTDKISIAQYTALTFTGFFFTRYALLVSPVNYVLCSVNIALFTSSSIQLGRKIKADYF